MSAILFQIQSSIIVLLMIWGVSKRRVRKLHIKIMSSVIIWDIILILQIELNRGAVAKASKVAKNHWLMNLHVAMAVATVLLYFVLIYSGRKLLKGNNEIRSLHQKTGMSAFSLRILTYVTSFFVVE
jgi:hypothetical protein